MATNYNVPNQDFVGFSYGKWHSIRNGHIFRTSDGNRYNTNLIPSTTDKTADVPGGNGQYFFGSFHKTKVFTVNFAFDELTESHYNSLRTVFNGTDIKELIFDEQPYKAYDAKVTGTPQLKVVCFDDPVLGRVYKGEGTVQFTCYTPYAHTPDWVYTASFGITTADGRLASSYDEKVYTSKAQWLPASGLSGSTSYNAGELPAPFKVRNASGTVRVGNNVITIPSGSGTWDSKMGVVLGGGGALEYTGNACATIPVGGSASCSGGTLEYQYWYY